MSGSFQRACPHTGLALSASFNAKKKADCHARFHTFSAHEYTEMGNGSKLRPGGPVGTGGGHERKIED